MLPGRNVDVSVILPFGDDEDVIGVAVQHVAAYLEAQGLGFEILAVDRDSGDNSHAVLALVRSRHPVLGHALHVLHAPGHAPDRGYAIGVARARGRVLWLLEPQVATGALEGFARAHAQIRQGERDVVVAADGFTVAHRTRSRPALDGLVGAGPRFHRRLARQARDRGLAVSDLRHDGKQTPGKTPRVWQRWIAALSLGFSS